MSEPKTIWIESFGKHYMLVVFQTRSGGIEYFIHNLEEHDRLTGLAKVIFQTSDRYDAVAKYKELLEQEAHQ